MRGARLPELAASDFVQMVAETSNQTAAQLYLELPSGLLRQQKTACMQEFEAARAHLLFVTTLKLSYFREPPALLFGAAHHRRAEAMRAIQICLASTNTHARILRLQGDLQDGAQLFFQGADLAELPALEQFVAELRWGG